MADLIAPHGGLSEPVCCTVGAGELDAFKAAAASLTKVPVSDADLSAVYRFADGALSPLTGPMDRATYNRVLDESVIEHNGKLYAWTIPISLPVTAELAGNLKPGQTVALTNSAGTIVATLAISDVFEWDKPRYIKSVYLTERTDHPGADMVLKGDADKTHLLGGTIRALPQPKHPKFGKYVLSPREVRKLLASKGWNRVSNPQSAAPGPRVCVSLRPGNVAQGGPQRRRGAQPVDRRNQGR
jgi:sulfate adenylyltransferase